MTQVQLQLIVMTTILVLWIMMRNLFLQRICLVALRESLLGLSRLNVKYLYLVLLLRCKTVPLLAVHIVQR